MIDGTYDVTMRILFSKQQGIVTLASDGATCTGSVELGGNAQTAVGTVDGDQFTFSGDVDTPAGKVAYEITGTADGETLSAVAKTKVGNFKIAGRRVQS